MYQCPDCGHTQAARYIRLLARLGRAFRGKDGHSVACPKGCGLMIRVKKVQEKSEYAK